jgi:hypothetical protein
VQINTANSAGKTYTVKLQVSTTKTIAAIEDSYVRPGYPNQGTGSTMAVKNDAGSYIREGYIKFDIGHLDLSDADIATAKVEITATAVGPTSNTILHNAELATDNDWTETGILWENKPDSTPLDAVQQWTDIQVGNPVLIDVTQEVKAALDSGSDVISLRIYATSPFDPDAWCDYASREHGNSNYRPKLVLNGI